MKTAVPNRFKILLRTHRYGADGATTMLLSLANYWVSELGWSVNALCSRSESRPETATLLARHGVGMVHEASAQDRYDLAIVNTLLDLRHVPGLARVAPVALWVHETEAMLDHWPMPVSEVRRCFQKAHRIIFQAPWQAWVFGSFIHRLPDGSVTCIPNGIAVPDIHLKAGHEGGLRRIVCLGSVIPRKRQGDLAKAVAHLIRHGHSLVCELIGDIGHLDSLGQENAQLIKTHPAVFLTGALPREEALSRLAGADVFVLPSSNESQGLAPLEAALLGVPVVLADLPVYRELGWRHGHNCLTYPLGDVGALAVCIDRLLSDQALASRMVRGGHDFAAGFSKAVFQDRMTALARDVAACSTHQG